MQAAECKRIGLGPIGGRYIVAELHSKQVSDEDRSGVKESVRTMTLRWHILPRTPRKGTAMDPVRTELHKGYKIVIYTWPERSEDGRVGMYAIYRIDNNERVKGGFVLTQDPEGTALEDARHWIDDQRS